MARAKAARDALEARAANFRPTGLEMRSGMRPRARTRSGPLMMRAGWSVVARSVSMVGFG